MEQRGQFFAVSDLDPDDKQWWWLFLSEGVYQNKELWKQIQTDAYTNAEPVRCRLFRGSVPPDVVGGTGKDVISERVVSILKRYACDNTRYVPLAIYDRSDKVLLSRQYYWLQTVAGSGMAQTDAGYNKLFNGSWKDDPLLQDAYGIRFDHNTWTGLDVFRIPKAHSFVVTRRVRDDLIAARLTGTRIDDVVDYCKDLRDWKVAIHCGRAKAGDRAPWRVPPE